MLHTPINFTGMDTVNVLHIIIYLSFIIINIINHKLIIKLQLSGKPYGHETPYDQY